MFRDPLPPLHPMDNSSETESDSESSNLPQTSQQTSRCLSQEHLVSNARHEKWSGPPLKSQDIGQEIQNLFRNVSFLGKSADVVEEVLLCSAKLVEFLDRLPRLLNNHDQISGCLKAFSALVDLSFIERLFEYRSFFRAQFTLTVVTWVDEFLAKLSSLVCTVAAGTTLVTHSVPFHSDSIGLQKRNDAILAASQLPETWNDVKRVLGSDNSSPAARRIALSLMFAIYVMRPQLTLTRNDLQLSSNLDMIESLFISAKIMSLRFQSPAFPLDSLEERTSAAMLISLLSVVDNPLDHQTYLIQPLRFRTEVQEYLLDLISATVGLDAGLFLPVENLDIPQTLLLRWGNVVPWSWSVWTDERNANTEYIRAVTITWLHHMTRPVFAALSTSEHEKIFSRDFRRCLFPDVTMSSRKILHLLRDALSVLVQGNSLLDFPFSPLPGLLAKLCWATIHLLEMNNVEICSPIQELAEDYSRTFLVLFCYLGFSEKEVVVQNLIVEALALIQNHSFSRCLQYTLQNKTLQFARKLDQSIRSSAKFFSQDEQGVPSGSRFAITAAKSLLNFLTIILLKDGERNIVLQDLALFYLDVIITFLASPRSEFVEQKYLLDSVLLSLCAFQSHAAAHSVTRFPEGIWPLVINVGNGNIATAAIFAEYLLLTELLCDRILCAEAWHFLLASLSAIIDPDITKQEEPLALLSCSVICEALSKLICSSDSLVRRSLLSSPWTTSIGMTLRSLLRHKNNSSPYLENLSFRLGNVGETLASLMLNESEIILDSGLAHKDMRLIFYRDAGYSGLLLTSDTII
ncbi:hypothetical protein CPB84DRAFT_1957224 [Gymnopilus junonius]|uniref:Uncharacterized protein n=1 Tax=Gymnopilus junonius TaxID=109634 RepID=A0A9P5P0B6_GYMJU|nr:hypothetical protein CPB84DRAFT_1957224 [Gymnopilus junonius]